MSPELTWFVISYSYDEAALTSIGFALNGVASFDKASFSVRITLIWE